MTGFVNVREAVQPVGLGFGRTTVRASRDVTESWILRALDEVNESLARRLAGESGVSLGYDVLELRVPPATQHGSVSVSMSARVTDVAGSCHAAEYRVTVRPHASDTDPNEGAVTVARAAGWTWTPSHGPLSARFALTPPAELSDRT